MIRVFMWHTYINNSFLGLVMHIIYTDENCAFLIFFCNILTNFDPCIIAFMIYGQALGGLVQLIIYLSMFFIPRLIKI